MTDNKPAPSKIIPNTFQTPNLLTDEGLLALLTGSETKCYLVVIRKTFGWRKDKDRIAKSQIMAVTGLGENAVDDCMTSLVAFGLVLRTAENNAANEGVEWAPQMDDSLIDMAGLLDRQAKAKASNAKRTQNARLTKGGGDVQHTPHVQHPQGGDVQHTPQQPITANVLIVVNAAGENFRLYEQEIGTLTPMIADAVKDAEETYSAEWVSEAIQIAATSNKRSWKYVEGILKNCKAKGIRPSLNRLENTNGNTSGNQKHPAQGKANSSGRKHSQRKADVQTGGNGSDSQPADDPEAVERHRERWNALREKANMPAV